MIFGKSVKLIIPTSFHGLNEFIEAERAHRQKGASMKRQAQRVVEMCAKTQLSKFQPT